MSSLNKTESVRTRIFKAILCGDYAPGAILPSEREMSESAGFSRVTVRRAYEQLEAAGILLRDQGRGTFVASHTSGNPEPCGQIALLASVADPFALEFIQAVENELCSNDMLLILRLTGGTAEKDEQAAADLVAKGVANLIIWPSTFSVPSPIFERLRVLGANMVFFDRIFPGSYADYVGLDNDDALTSLFNCAKPDDLVRPVFVTHSDLVADSDRMRERAFLANCQRRGLDGKVVALPRKDGLPELPQCLLDASAVFCVNDAMGLKLLPLLKGQPIFSIDGLTDKFVTYKQPMAEMAKAAVAALLNQQRKGAKWKATTKYFKGVPPQPRT